MILKKRFRDSFIRLFTILLAVAIIIPAAFSSAAYANEEPEPEVTSAIVVNVTRDQVLFEKEADARIYPASTTKVLTALVIADSLESGKYTLDDTFPAYDKLYFDIPADGSTAYIQPGEVMTVRDYLYCAMLSSANEACNALAYYNSGSIKAFVKEMNKKAEEIGCTDSHFSDTHGIHQDDHYSTARDMYRIFRAAMEDPIISEICTTFEYIVPETNESYERDLTNTNLLLHSDVPFYYEYALGGKTGFTDEAGSCLVSAAMKDGDMLICVVMGAEIIETEDERWFPGSFPESKSLYEWCYSEYGDQPLLLTDSTVRDIPVKYGKDVDSVPLAPENDVYYYMKKTDAENNVSYKVELDPAELTAPVTKGDKAGTISVVFNGETIGETALLATEDVELSYFRLCIGKFNENIEIRIGVYLTVGLICVILVIRRLLKKKRADEDEPEDDEPEGDEPDENGSEEK